jgi:superfamily II DNA or RNA helicase
MSLDNVRTGFATNWLRTNVDVMQPKEIGFVHPPRKWQSECFKTIASNNPISIINAPTGSGKSTMLSMLAYQRTVSDVKKKTIIAVPQTVIGKGFNTKVFKLPDGQVIDWSVGVDLCTNAKDTVEQFTNFVKEDIFYSEAYPFERILVCTHATLVSAFQSLSQEDKQTYWNNLLVCIDETHHLQMHEIADEVYNMNSLGQVVDYSFRNNNEIILVSATMFRGDQKGLVSDELLKDAVKYNLPFDKYMEEMKHLKSFSYDFIIDTNEYTQDISKCINNLFSDNLKKLFIYIPHPKSYMSSGNKIQEIQDILEQLKTNLNGDKITLDENTGIYHITNILGLDYKVCDLVDENLSKRSIRFVNNEIINKDKDALDCVIALNRAKEGFDWEHANGMIVVGQRNSLTDVIQMVGRLLRDKQGKEKVKALHMLPFSPNQPTAPNLDNSLNDFFKAIAISLLMEDVFAPTPLQTNDESAPTGQLSGSSSSSVSSNIFDDLELDENQRLDLFDKAQKSLVNIAGGLVESQGTYSPEELKEQMPSIMQKWVEENNIEADEDQIEELAKKVYNQFAKRTLQMQGINVSNINWQMIESADPIEFTLRYVGKDTTLESLKELRRLIAFGESESNAFCHEYFQFYLEKGFFPRVVNTYDEKEIYMSKKMTNMKVAYKQGGVGKSGNVCYPSNIEIAKSYGFDNFFDTSQETKSNETCHNVCQWVLANNKNPSGKSKDKIESDLGIWLVQNKMALKGNIINRTFYQSNQEIANSYGLNNLFETFDKEKISNQMCHKVCQWMKANNESPSQKSNNPDIKDMGVWIASQKRNKHKLNIFYQSNQVIAESYGMSDLFELENKEKNANLICIEVCEFYKKFSKIPSSSSNDIDEKKLGGWLSKQRQSKDNINPERKGTFYQCNQVIAESYGLPNLFEKTR